MTGIRRLGRWRRRVRDYGNRKPNLLDVWVLRGVLDNPGPVLVGDEYWMHPYLDDFEQVEDEGRDQEMIRMVSHLEDKLDEYESRDLRLDSVFDENAERLCRALGLGLAERYLLSFSYHLEENEGIQNIIEVDGRLNSPRLARLLARVFDVREDAVRGALDKDGPLCSTGLVSIRYSGALRRQGPIQLMDGLEDVLLREYRDDRELHDYLFPVARKASLALGDFPHIRDEVSDAVAVVRQAVEQGVRGVNLLIHGDTGTGKTELARALGEALGITLHEVAVVGTDGDVMHARERLAHYRLGQRVLGGDNPAVILFDEIEDIFPSRALSFFGLEKETGDRKGFLNRLLEDNPVPAIWVSNGIRHIDPAYIRRFRQVLEVPRPPRSVRRSMLARAFEGVGVGEEWIERIATSDQLTPADIERAAWLGRIAAEGDVEARLERALASSLAARGSVLRTDVQPAAGTRYRIEYVNASVDPARIARGLEDARRCTMALHGPPGTGKTAFARWLADRLDRPLVLRRASDLLSCWLGASEKNIAAMFRQAEREGAVLLLDEADSFLRDRRGAVRSWEVTQVNELLVQMETFQGIFVCSTNLVDDLDQASFRRFDLKVEFRYLTRKQVRSMFQDLLCALDAGNMTDTDDVALSRLVNLTPGDFATVRRRLGVLGGRPCSAAIVRALEDECAAKKDGSNRNTAGFRA